MPKSKWSRSWQLGIAVFALGRGLTTIGQPLVPALVQSAWHSNGSLDRPTCTVSFPSNNAAGNAIIVAITIGALSHMEHPTLADTQGNIYYPATGQIDWQTIGGGGSSQLFYAPNIKGGPNTVTMTEIGGYNGVGNAFNQIAVYEYSGLALAAPLDVSAASFGNTSSNGLAVTSGTATTSSDGELIFGFGTTYSGVLSAGSGFTSRSTPFALIEDLVQTGAGPIAATANNDTTNDLYVMLMATFRPALGPYTGPVLPVLAEQMITPLTTFVITNTGAELDTNLLETQTILFGYTNREALLADGWSFLATNPDGTPRNTEITNSADGALVSYNQTAHPGLLRIPCDMGDLVGSANNTRNSLFRALATNWVSQRLALTFLPLTNYQQANLMLYQDDDNFVQAGMAYNNGILTVPGVVVLSESGGNSSFLRIDLHWISGGAIVSNLVLRLDREPVSGTISTFGSLDGVDWQYVGSFGQTLVDPRLGIWVGGSLVPYTNTLPNCDLRQLDILTRAPGPKLAYQLVVAPNGASIDANGVITWVPGLDAVGSTNVFTTVVTDVQTPTASATNSFAVIVDAPPPAPVLLSISLTNNLAVISWPASSGSSYRLQSNDDCATTNWMDVMPDILASGGTASATIPLDSASARFYRVISLP